MKLLRGLIVLMLVLGMQAGLGRLWPSAHRFVDLMYLPVVWHAVQRSQRSAMLTGCMGGLLQDAWFQIGVFGLNGFKKTLLGWALGGVGSRFDLNRQGALFACAILVSLADGALDLGLRRLLDLRPGAGAPLDLLSRALSTGLLVILVFPLVHRARESRLLSRWV